MSLVQEKGPRVLGENCSCMQVVYPLGKESRAERFCEIIKYRFSTVHDKFIAYIRLAVFSWFLIHYWTRFPWGKHDIFLRCKVCRVLPLG